MPDAALEAVPPGQLADAWQRDEKAKQLVEVLKGCSIYLVGLGGRKSAVGRVLSRRLRYRCYDISTIMCSTYAALGEGGDLSLSQLVAKEPLADVEQLSGAVLTQVQQFTRSVFVAWGNLPEPKPVCPACVGATCCEFASLDALRIRLLPAWQTVPSTRRPSR